MQKINDDTSDDDTDETITFDDDKVKKTYRSANMNDELINGSNADTINWC